MQLRPALATCVLGLLVSAFALPSSAELYRWVDDEGELHFTSDLNQVPPAYRNRTTAPRQDAGSTLNVAPSADDPDQNPNQQIDPQYLRDQRMRQLRRTNASGGGSQAQPRKALESPGDPPPAADD